MAILEAAADDQQSSGSQGSTDGFEHCSTVSDDSDESQQKGHDEWQAFVARKASAPVRPFTRPKGTHANRQEKKVVKKLSIAQMQAMRAQRAKRHTAVA
jgi:hypothetical protein